MSKAAVSVFVFGCYLMAIGLTLMVAPNFLLRLFGFASTTEVWIRVLGVVSAILGTYYVQAARSEVTPFIRWTIAGRAVGFVAFAAFVVLNLAQPMLALFAAIDGVGALWTALAMRKTSAP